MNLNLVAPPLNKKMPEVFVKLFQIQAVASMTFHQSILDLP